MQKWKQIQGVYIHTPFCLQKCLYCDFASYAGADTETMEKYVDAVCSEIMMRSNEVTIADQATLYFGGGTPSLLSEKLLAKLVEALQKNGCWLQPAEATIEVNPGTADLDKLRFFKDLGFDRISFGVQSLNDAELRAVGRIHTANEALDAITMAEKAGFTRVSADLIYGLPEQSLQTLKTSLQNLTAAGLQHLSVYGLTIEKNTPLAGMLDKGKVELPDEDCQLAMYELVQEYLEAQGLLVKVEEHVHNVGTHDRCGTTVEPMIKQQWFVKMEPLAKPAIESVEKGEIKFVPDRFTKNYLNWMRGSRDWCISRQLWWGHQIPAWYCADCGATTVAKSAPAACPHCGSTNLTQDPDTLDTWFSSALWPFSTLGWPNENAEDYNYFYPTNTLVTGYDIIGFWVSRMIFSGLAYTGKAPFDTVLIHGIVRDSQGRKMSKSLGNGIDPLKVIDEYGADALRMMLMVGSTAGNDMRYSDEKVTASRNFANKLWNASRFVQMNLPEDFEPGMPAEELLDMSDKWVLSELARTAAEVTANLDKYELGLAAEKVENFIWDIYCDWYIEICKSRLNGEDAQQADTARKVLVWVLDKALKLLHPFMPFITEEIYQALPGSAETIMTQEWPDAGKMTAWPQECADFEVLMDYIKAVRTIRNDMNVHPAKKTSMTIETANPAAFQKGGAYLARFAFATDVALTEKYTGTTDGVVTVVTPAARGFIPMMELIDREKELKRLHKELEKAEKEANMFRNQLNNPKFVERAPEKLVNETRTKLAASEDKIANINQSIQALG